MGQEPHDAGPHRMAAELRDRPEAVRLLVAMHAAGGTATLDELSRRSAAPREIGAALCWLAAVGLVRKSGDSGSWDNATELAIYELSDRGAPLVTALIALETLDSETRRPGPIGRFLRRPR